MKPLLLTLLLICDPLQLRPVQIALIAELPLTERQLPKELVLINVLSALLQVQAPDAQSDTRFLNRLVKCGELFRERPQIVDGFMAVPDQPCLGLELRDETLEKYCVKLG